MKTWEQMSPGARYRLVHKALRFKKGLVRFASQTPLKSKDVIEAARVLMSFGIRS